LLLLLLLLLLTLHCPTTGLTVW